MGKTAMHIRLILQRILPTCLTAVLLALSIGGYAQSLFSDDEFLPPDEAFRLNVVRTDTGFSAHWSIANQYYLYRDKIKIESAQGAVRFSAPPGVLIKDEFFGETQVFRHFVEVPFQPQSSSEEGRVQLTYQGCADAGLCYPPITRQVALSTVAFKETASSRAGSAPVSEQLQILQRLKDASWLATVVVFLGFGLLLALTPCILPMVPILSGIIAGRGRRVSSGKAFMLSLTYVLAMAVTYSLFGVAIGLTGEFLQVWFQQPWLIGSFAALFVLLALSMFGLYDLQMPAAVQTWLSERSRRSGGDPGPALGSVALMGCLSALIIGPCTTAPLIGALLFIAQTGDAVVGGIALFSLALGMGIPLLLIGTALGRLMPQPGAMLNAVKGLFGLLMLGVAVWMLDRVVPAQLTLLLSGALLVFTAAYLYQLSKRGAFGLHTTALTHSMSAIVLLYGFMLIVGASTGGSSLVRPLEYFVATADNAPQPHSSLDFMPVASLQELQRNIGRAEQQGQRVMLDFYADWCVACKELEAFTFSNTEVKAALSDVVLLQADVTQGNDPDKELLSHFGLFGPPAILFFDANGYEFESARVVGYMNAEKFVRHIEQTFNTRRT